MILAFMSLSTGEQVKSAKLASEIAIALCATLEGLTLALPAIWFYAVLKNMVHRLVFELESVAESYLRRFSQAVKK
jgi:biopolymer transport protein ExbB